MLFTAVRFYISQIPNHVTFANNVGLTSQIRYAIIMKKEWYYGKKRL